MRCMVRRKDVFSNTFTSKEEPQKKVHGNASCGSLGFVYFFDAYPSAYHPPPFNLKVQDEIIFFAFLLHFGHLMESVPILTNFSVTVPSEHLNSYTGILKPLWYCFATNIIHIKQYVKMRCPKIELFVLI